MPAFSSLPSLCYLPLRFADAVVMPPCSVWSASTRTAMRFDPGFVSMSQASMCQDLCSFQHQMHQFYRGPCQLASQPAMHAQYASERKIFMLCIMQCTDMQATTDYSAKSNTHRGVACSPCDVHQVLPAHTATAPPFCVVYNASENLSIS